MTTTATINPRPKALPVWFVPLVRYSVGLQARPVLASKPAPQWAQNEINKFKAWNEWQDRKRPAPRPNTFWRVVPTDWSQSPWSIRRELLKQKPHTTPSSPVISSTIPQSDKLPGLWVSDNWNPDGPHLPIEQLLNNLATMSARSVLFQASSMGWDEAYWKCMNMGYQCELWTSCSQISPLYLTKAFNEYKPARTTIQIESQQELNDFVQFHDWHVFDGRVVDVVIIGPVGDAASFGTLLRSLGVQRTHCEVYRQDGRNEDMVNQARKWWNCPSPLPAWGWYNAYGPTSYDTSVAGVKNNEFTSWRYEQLRLT